MDSEILTSALRVNWLNLALGHRRFEAEGATFVVNEAFPSIYDANFVYDVEAASEAEIDALFARARAEYAHCKELTFRIGPGVSPAFEARLGMIGTERNRTLVMSLQDSLPPPAPTFDLRPIDDEAGWRAFVELKRADWSEHAPKVGEDPGRSEIADGLAATARLKSPPVRYHLAWVDDRPVGYLNSWEGVAGVGQVEDLFVLPESRRRGIATALLHHGVADARKHGAETVVICSDPADTPKSLYAAMGWRPIALCRQYAVERELATALRRNLI